MKRARDCVIARAQSKGVLAQDWAYAKVPILSKIG
jgi:hypothetical protein